MRTVQIEREYYVEEIRDLAARILRFATNDKMAEAAQLLRDAAQTLENIDAEPEYEPEDEAEFL